MRNQKGVSLVEALLILVVIIIIGNTGRSQQEAGKSMGKAGGASEPGAKQVQRQRDRPVKIDKTADWITFVSSQGGFSLRHPKYWAVGFKEPQSCFGYGASNFVAGADADLVAECGTEYKGQIYVSFKEGNQLEDHKLETDKDFYQNLSGRKVTVDNIEGTRESGVAKGQMGKKFEEKYVLPGLPDGTKVVVYSFYTRGRTYVAEYNHRIGEPDILRDFDLMVTKTLKFSGRTLSAKGKVGAASRRTVQDEKPAVTPVQLENEADAPLVITEAAAEISAPYETTLKGTRGDGQEVTLINKWEKARLVKLTLKFVNKSDHTITQCIVRILNPAFLSDESILVGSSLWIRNPGWPLEIKPQETFTVTTDFPLADRRNGQELADHLSGFRVKVAETDFKPAVSREWIEGGNFSNLYGRVEDMVMVIDCADGTVFRFAKKRPASEPPPKGILVPTESCGPQIVYKQAVPFEIGRPAPDGLQASGEKDSDTPLVLYYEKAKYTEDALQNKTQGLVLLYMSFNANGTITDISVKAGLPDVLTEKAIEAARKIRFQPAVKGGVPISVRRPLLYSFTLY
jgi:TonB family protein